MKNKILHCLIICICFSLNIFSQIEVWDGDLAFTTDYIFSYEDFFIYDDDIPSESVSENEDIVKARCFCRIGNDRGSRQKEFPNALKDLGVLKSWGGPIGGTQNREDECGRLCSFAASDWLNKLSYDALCKYVKKSGSQRVVAYSKVGGRDWTVRGAGKKANCCNARLVNCPSGTNSEDENFPGQCSKHMCGSISEINKRFYDVNGKPIGFIWNNNMYSLVPARVSYTGWKSCN